MKPFDKALAELQRKEEATRLQLEEEIRQRQELEAAIKNFPNLLEKLKQEDSRVAEYLAQAEELKGEGIDAVLDQDMADSIKEMVKKNPELFPPQTGKPKQPIPNKAIVLTVVKDRKSEYSAFDERRVEMDVNYYVCLFTTAKGTCLTVIENEFRQLGHVWTERELVYGGETLKRLVNPETTLDVLFEHRKPEIKISS